jgi:hypothetical protein
MTKHAPSNVEILIVLSGMFNASFQNKRFINSTAELVGLISRFLQGCCLGDVQSYGLAWIKVHNKPALRIHKVV